MIDSSNWSPIFCVNCSRSSGAMDEDVGSSLKPVQGIFFMVTPTPAARTRLGCSGGTMAIVSTSSRPWATKLPCEACSSREPYNQKITKISFIDPTIIIKNDHWKMRVTYNSFLCSMRRYLTRYFHAGHLPLHVWSNGRWRINDYISALGLGCFLQLFLFLVLHQLFF